MKVAVIGAGYAGLVSGRELQREGHDVVVFEKTDQIGGTWAYNPRVDSDPMGLDPNREVVHSSMFQSLRVNLPRQLMGFLDYPLSVRADGSGDPRTFPGHEEVLRFLNDFARDFGLVDLIRLGHEVVRVEPLTREDKDKWAVEWRRRGGESEVEIFEAVVICNGKYTEPLIAQFPGVDVWPGVQIHSHSYRVPDPFQDQVVVIIGNGPSAIEIIRDVKSVAKQVHQVTRTKIIRDFVKAPSTIRHPMIKCAHKDGKLDFEDGSSMFPDAIIHCTGYKCHIPFLRTNGIVKVEDFRVGPLYQHVFPPKLAPRLSFVGLPHFTANVVMMELQSKWVAKVLSGKVSLPSEEEMSSSACAFYKQMEEAGLPKSSTHKLSPHCEYEKWIVSELGMQPLEKWRVTMFPTLLTQIVREHGAHYLDTWDVHKWIQETESSSLICKI